jgi:hypothetical protein
MIIRSTSPCVLCRRDDRIPDKGIVCDACRAPLPHLLTDIATLYATITGTPDLVPDVSRKPAPGPNGTKAITTIPAEKDGPIGLEILHRDAVAERLPAGPVAGDAGQPRVTGSREAPLPLPVDQLDIALPERQGSVPATYVPATVLENVKVNHRYIRIDIIHKPDGSTETVPVYVVDELTAQQRRPRLDSQGRQILVDGRDQVGHISTATILDSWVRSWRDARNLEHATEAQASGEVAIRGEVLPAPTVPHLANWLQVRLGWACDSYEEIAECVRELRFLRVVLRGIAREDPPKPEHLWTPCKRCDLITLWRNPEEAYPVTCHSCGSMMTVSEYEDWSRLVAGANKSRKAVA